MWKFVLSNCRDQKIFSYGIVKIITNSRLWKLSLAGRRLIFLFLKKIVKIHTIGILKICTIRFFLVGFWLWKFSPATFCWSDFDCENYHLWKSFWKSDIFGLSHCAFCHKWIVKKITDDCEKRYNTDCENLH